MDSAEANEKNIILIRKGQSSMVRVILSLNRFIRGRTTTNYDINSSDQFAQLDLTHRFPKTTTYYAPHLQ